MNLKTTLIALVVLTLNACGPVYRTDYTFTPPRSADGRVCIQQCENSKLQCQQIEDMQADRCRDRVQMEQQRCEDELYWKKGRDSKWYECGASETCTADYDKCDNRYRSCYQACGGSVDAYTHCVANCEMAQQPGSPPPSYTPPPPIKSKSKPVGEDPYRRY